MNIISEFLIYVIEQRNEIFTLLFQHIRLTVFSVIFSIMLGVPLGILIKYVKKLNKPILGFANIVQAIPSMALLGISIPILGIGSAPAIFMVILYSLLPIIKNTYTGLSNISPQILEAAKGIGLTKTQRLFKIQIPLSLPVIMAGIRVSAVTSVGLMTIAAYVGAGGLGYLVFAGIRTINNYQIMSKWCYDKAEEYKTNDQSILNLLIQEFNIETNDLTESYGAYPTSIIAENSHIIHAIGPAKFWRGTYNKEWEENNKIWIEAGGNITYEENTKKRKQIDKIVWFIPTFKLRDKVRRYLLKKIGLTGR